MAASQWWPAEVLTHERRGADVVVFTCRTRRAMPFRAGQHVEIECPYRPWQSSPYAMANAPRRDRVLEFHVRAGSPSGVSAALVERLKPGDTLRLGEPHGSMALNPYSRRDLVFITGGTGLAPAKALIDELSRYNRTRWIHLFRAERDDGAFYDREPLDRLAVRHPWLTIVRTTADVAEAVAARGPWPHHDFYISGPQSMVDCMLERLEALRVPAARIQYDAFALR
ncbi:FAD-binding oxidoreductase [Actinoplanes sp. NPDC048796]|uniref:FAD-binding oxidoreductase n=1 Tax=unclassified Actinoplanes TaxID=2626549 RepID=UPI003411120B